jgi:hypothetical protein
MILAIVLATPLVSAYDQVLYCPDAANPIPGPLASIQRTGKDHFQVAGHSKSEDYFTSFYLACECACDIQIKYDPYLVTNSVISECLESGKYYKDDCGAQYNTCYIAAGKVVWP